MRKKLLVSLIAALLLMGIGYVAMVYGQGPTGAEYTSYQVVNLGDDTATVVVEYYDEAGNRVDAATKTLTIPVGGSATVLQKLDDPNLEDGVYSAVLSSDQPIAAIVNQQRADPGTAGFNPFPPFSTYTGASSGATSVTLPVIEYNWYSGDGVTVFNSMIRVQNAGTKDADVLITYYPGLAGNSGVTQSATIKPGAAASFDQADLTDLGAPSGSHVGRFLGSALVESTGADPQPLVVIVNENNPAAKQKFTYNGFTAGSSEIAVPVVMAKHYDNWTSLTVANTSKTDPVDVQITYQADTVHTLPAEKRGTTKTVSFTLQPGEAKVRYEGPGTSTDLADVYFDFDRFFGTARIVATGGMVVAKINQSSANPLTAGQSGSYNGVPVAEATTEVAAPLIQGGPFYGYYTSLTCMNVSDNDGQVDITYTSDGTYSEPKNHSEKYTHSISAGGVLNRWEGPGASAAQADITGKGVWTRFLGSAKIEATVPIVCMVNSQRNNPSGVSEDSLFTYNAINVVPSP